ncbi:MAG TPA: N-6 DNA methylase [Bacteroidia bacterium]|nr:N-6 DNA methylase [Bacteroidia bacterium]
MNNIVERYNAILLAKKENLKKDLWMYFLRAKGLLELEDLSFIFLFLELKSKGFLENIDHRNARDIKNSIFQIFKNLNEEDSKYKNSLTAIYDVYSKHIHDANDFTLTELIQILNQSSDVDFFKSIYAEFFEFFLEKYQNHLGKNAAMYTQPNELTEFCISIAEPLENDKIYNPFAGLASFGVTLPKGSYYYGQEKYKQTWAIAILRLLAHDKFDNFEFTAADSILNWAPYFEDTFQSDERILSAYVKPKQILFDLVISNPPFGLKVPDGFITHVGFPRTAESLLIEKGIEVLSNKGKLLAIVSNGFLFSGGRELEIRKKIIENDLLDTIIHFPSGVLKNTALPFSLILLNKTKRNKGKVKLIDASNYFIGERKRDAVLDYKLLLKEFRNDFDTISQRIIENELFLKNDYNLSVLRYFIDKNHKELAQGVRLDKLLQLIKGAKVNKETNGKLIKIGDLDSNSNNNFLDVTKLETSEIKSEYREIKESCLLIANKGNILKPTYFNFENESIFIGPNIFAFKFDTEKIDILYLINELQTDYCNDQLAKLRTGGVIPSLRIKDFLNVIIELPNIEVQRARYKRTVDSLNQFNVKVHDLEKEITSQNSYLRHKIAGSFNNIEGYMQNVLEIFNNNIIPNYPSVENLKVSPKHIFTFKEYLNKMNTDILKMKEIVSKQLKVDSDIHTKQLTSINIVAFIQNYVNEIKDRANLNFDIIFEMNEDAFCDEAGKFHSPLVMANEELLKNLFDNLLDNAIEHAFITEEKNKIEIWVSKDNGLEKSEFIVLFSNNGKPLPENFTYEMFITKGLKAGDNRGDGFGGWYINEIMRKMGGSIEIIDERVGHSGIALDNLSTSFELFFPIIDTLDNE